MFKCWGWILPALVILAGGCRGISEIQEKKEMVSSAGGAIPCFPELQINTGGKLTENFWSAAAVIAPRQIFKSPGTFSDAETEIKFCMDRKNLYIGIICVEPLEVNASTGKDSPWAGDNVEVFIANTRRPHWYRQVVVGANGKRFSRMLHESDWTADIDWEKTQWSAKITIPLDKLGGMDGGVMINVLRERKVAKELITWQDLAERALEVEKFGRFDTCSSLVRTPWTTRIKKHSAGVTWETALPDKGRIFYRKCGSPEWREVKGVQTATPCINTVEITGLDADTEYEYFVPGMADHGKFRTLSAVPADFTVAMVSDIHCRAQQLGEILRKPEVRAADLFFLLGDQLEASLAPEMHYEAFLNTLTDNWAKPFYCIYGNHEGRGAAAESFYDLFCSGSRGYDAFEYKGVFFVILDTDHDNGISPQYRQEQFEFLKKTIASAEFKAAQYRILLTHVPVTFMYGRWGGDQRAIFEALSPEERGAFDAAFSGHIHYYCRTLPGEDKLYSTKPALNGTTGVYQAGFPEFTAPELGSFIIRKTDEYLNVKVYDMAGQLLDDRKITKKQPQAGDHK